MPTDARGICVHASFASFSSWLRAGDILVRKDTA